MLRFLICVSTFLTVLELSAAYWIDTDAYEDYPSEESALNVFSEVKRDTCAQWGRICVPSSKYKFVQCCGGLVCSCNIWKTTCKCRAKLG
ncbi:hypothetical protein ACJMK2_028721 [Sinanodonta woodiana]|uniref:Uncharacterized protein n=1 Tax=Sinanodonta woodiana TaxID=1069815 RepID=A0ABD3X7Z3_SINWO